MSNRMCCEIRVGGPLTGVQMTHLLHMEHWDVFDIITENSPRNEDSRIFLQYFEASNGEMPTVENWLVENRIAFDRYSDGRYEYNPEVRMYRPGIHYSSDQNFNTDTDGKIVVKREDLVKCVAKAMDGGTPAGQWGILMQELDTLAGFCIPDLEPPYISSGRVNLAEDIALE